ncbi:hypothetical protein QTO34_006063 [Cnephaeus nilssonii]|uniref:Uncharacterized protein n=1 Tax=Cnephaeus nilssonii TaxID=3371016 RepID=A0AA40LIQ0_CNENI|nr:hypothetical protein QTO34_006063 [Eptesicus nilssonii]
MRIQELITHFLRMNEGASNPIWVPERAVRHHHGPGPYTSVMMPAQPPAPKKERRVRQQAKTTREASVPTWGQLKKLATDAWQVVKEQGAQVAVLLSRIGKQYGYAATQVPFLLPPQCRSSERSPRSVRLVCYRRSTWLLWWVPAGTWLGVLFQSGQLVSPGGGPTRPLVGARFSLQPLENVKTHVQEPPQEVKSSQLPISTGSEQSKDSPREGGHGTGPASKGPPQCLPACPAGRPSPANRRPENIKGNRFQSRACRLLESRTPGSLPPACSLLLSAASEAGEAPITITVLASRKSTARAKEAACAEKPLAASRGQTCCGVGVSGSQQGKANDVIQINGDLRFGTPLCLLSGSGEVLKGAMAPTAFLSLEKTTWIRPSSLALELVHSVLPHTSLVLFKLLSYTRLRVNEVTNMQIDRTFATPKPRPPETVAGTLGWGVAAQARKASVSFPGLGTSREPARIAGNDQGSAPTIRSRTLGGRAKAGKASGGGFPGLGHQRGSCMDRRKPLGRLCDP